MASEAKERRRETNLGSVVCLAELVADDVGPHVGGAQRGAAVHAVVGLRVAVRETLPVLPETSGCSTADSRNGRSLLGQGIDLLTGILIRGAVAGMPPHTRSITVIVPPFLTPKSSTLLESRWHCSVSASGHRSWTPSEINRCWFGFKPVNPCPSPATHHYSPLYFKEPFA